MRNNYNGFEFLYDAAPGGGSQQWDIFNAISQQNGGSGFFGYNAANANGIGPWITQSVSFANQAGGFSFNGTPGFPISDIRLTNVIASTENSTCIYLNTYGGTHILINPNIENAGFSEGIPYGFAGTLSVASHIGDGLALTVNNTSGILITGGTYWNNSWSGLSLAAPGAQLIGGQSVNNGLALDPALHRRAGVFIGADNALVSGHTFLHTGGAYTLHYIYMAGAISHVEIGHNSYHPALAASAWVDSSGVPGPVTQLPNMTGGLVVHTGVTHAYGLGLFDAAPGAVTPHKYFRATGGQLQVINEFGAIVQTLTDQGTPGWPNRRGQVLMPDNVNTVTVTLSPAEPDNQYFVQLTVATGTSVNLSAYTVVGVDKSPGSFLVKVAAPPGAGTVVVYDWLVHR